MNITRDEARRIAGLAHLELDDASLERMAAEMTKILGYIDQLREVRLDDDAGETQLAPTPLRDDTARPSIERELAAGNAPAWNDGFFVVPQVIGGD